MAISNHERFIYSPRNLAKGFVQVSSDIVDTPSTQLEVKWYRSHFVDLQIWLSKENKVIRQQFSFMGTVVEWNHIQGIKTGMVEDIKSQSEKRSWSVKIIYDESYIEENLEQAMEVLNHCIPFAEKDEVIKNFENNPTLTRWQSAKLIFRHFFNKNAKNKK